MTAIAKPEPTFAPLIARYRVAYQAAHGHEPPLLDVDEAAGTFAMMRFETKDRFDAREIAEMVAHLEWRKKAFKGDKRR